MSDTITEQHLISINNKYFHYQPTHVSPHYTHLRLRFAHYVVPNTATFAGSKSVSVKIYGCQDRGYYKDSNGSYKTFTYCLPLQQGQNIIHHPQEESYIKLNRDFNLQNLRIEILVQDDTDSSRPQSEELINSTNPMNLSLELESGII